MSTPSESTQPSTMTRSDTKLGIWHLRRASLPMITDSLYTSTSNCWMMTGEEKWHVKLVVRGGGKSV
jgi:hypothetical protein